MIGIFQTDLLSLNSGLSPVEDATVTVRLEPGGQLAPIFSDIEGTPKSNPFTSDGTNLEFYANDTERYRIDIVAGSFNRTLRWRTVNPRPFAGQALGATDIFEDTAAGMSATDPGDYFFTLDDDENVYLNLFLNDDDEGTLLGQYPDYAAVEQVVDLIESGDLAVIVNNIEDIQDIAQALDEALAAGISYDNTESGLDAENMQAAIDELVDSVSSIATKEIGEVFAIQDNLTGATQPDNSGSAKFIKLTAGLTGASEYNEGLLTNESISGSAPLVQATAEIVGGPMDGQTVRLLNTENRYLMPGTSPGTVANDQMQQITGRVNTGAALITGGEDPPSGAFSVAAGDTQRVGTGTGSNPNSLLFDSADSPDARTGDHTNVKHIQATFYMRVQ